MNQTGKELINSILRDGILLKTPQSHNGTPVVMFNPAVSKLRNHPDFSVFEAQGAELPEGEKPSWHS